MNHDLEVEKEMLSKLKENVVDLDGVMDYLQQRLDTLERNIICEIREIKNPDGKC